jgi:hypothetical protein
MADRDDILAQYSPPTLGDGPRLPNVMPREMRTEPLGQSNFIHELLSLYGRPSMEALQRGYEGRATPQEIAHTFFETGPVGPFGSVMRDPLFHGTPRRGLTELAPSERGPLGPGVYTSPSREIAGSYAGPEGTIHTLPERGRDVYHGHGHRTDAEWFGFKDDRQRLINAADETHRPVIAELVDRMWSSDGYPLYQRLRQLLGSDEAAQALYRRAGFEGISGLVDGPEVLLFAQQQLSKP